MPLATVCSQISGLPTLFVRKQAKAYGTCRLAEGVEVRGRRLAVIEDVVTSGGQVVDSCCELREQGAHIAFVLCVIDRGAGGADSLAREELELRSLFTASEFDGAVREDPLTRRFREGLGMDAPPCPWRAVGETISRPARSRTMTSGPSRKSTATRLCANHYALARRRLSDGTQR